jgi:hypothetical protein
MNALPDMRTGSFIYLFGGDRTHSHPPLPLPPSLLPACSAACLQELEKFKFVLNYKIQELKRQIMPRKREIQEMREQMKEMVGSTLRISCGLEG